MVSALPVIGTMLDAVDIVVLIHMLRVMLARVFIRVVVTHVMGALRLHIVVLTVLLAPEVTLISNVRLVVAQVPISLFEVSRRVVLFAMHHDPLAMNILGMRVLERSYFRGQVVSGKVSFLATLRRSRSCLFLLYLGKVMHLFIEEGSIGTKVLLGISFCGRWFLVMVWVVVVRILRNFCIMLVLVRTAVSELFFRLERVMRHRISVRCVRISVPGISLVAIFLTRLAVTVARIRTIWVWSSTIGRHKTTFEALVKRNAMFTTHMAVVLLSTDVKVLITLLGLLALCRGVLRHGFGLNGQDLRRLKSVDTVKLFGFVGLHLEHKMAVVDIGLRGAECRRISIKGSVIALMPARGIKSVKLIAPLELEALRVRVISVGLDEVILDSPGHVLGIKALAPGLKRWSPEVHHDALGLDSQLYRLFVLLDAAHFLVVDRPGNKLRGPLKRIHMPVILGIEVGLVVVRLMLRLAITVDHIHRERVLLNRGNDLDVKFIPPTGIKVGAVPVSEEGSDCALLVGSSHAGDKLAVSELLVASNGTRFKL